MLNGTVQRRRQGIGFRVKGLQHAAAAGVEGFLPDGLVFLADLLLVLLEPRWARTQDRQVDIEHQRPELIARMQCGRVLGEQHEICHGIHCRRRNTERTEVAASKLSAELLGVLAKDAVHRIVVPEGQSQKRSVVVRQILPPRVQPGQTLRQVLLRVVAPMRLTPGMQQLLMRGRRRHTDQCGNRRLEGFKGDELQVAHGDES